MSTNTSAVPGNSSIVCLSSSIVASREVRGGDPEVDRLRERGRRGARPFAPALLARSISSCDGAKASTLCTTRHVLPASLWSTRPFTITTSSTASAASCSASALPNTSISTAPSRSSSVANIMWSPLRVRMRLASVMIPPTVTQSLSRRSASAEIGQSTRARSASRSGFSGCAETNSPIASFSAASSSGCSNSSVGIGGCTGCAKRRQRRRRAERRRRPRLPAGRRSSPARSARPAGSSGLWPAPARAPRACPCGSRRSSRGRRT